MATAYALRALEGHLVRSKRGWRSMFAYAVLSPLLFLGAMGWGVGSIVRTPDAVLGGLSYRDFVAPGLLAAAAMQVAVGEATWPVVAAAKWHRTYHAMLATPLGVRDLLRGHLLHVAIRLAVGATAFAAAAVALGYRAHPLGLLAVPVAVLTGMAFAVPITAWSVGRRATDSFALIYRVGVVPLFLFSGTFFPLGLLPEPLQALAWATPLWHGTDLCRALATGDVRLGVAFAHVGYLVGMTWLGLRAGYRAYERALRR